METRVIKNIAIHHAGGVANNAYASSRGLTWKQVNDWHKQRWNFESQYIPGSYGGYNFIYDPKDRSFHQFRAIGEETAAQIGYNFDTVSICIIGNYSLHNGVSVDPMTKSIEYDIASFVLDLISGAHTNIIAVNTDVSLSITRAFSHRHYQKGTECYGTALTDEWIQNVLTQYKKDSRDFITERAVILRKLVKLYLQLQTLIAKQEVKKRQQNVSASDRSCEGFITNDI
jgi:hypothetical protein